MASYGGADADGTAWRVGALAAATGLTVRTLHDDDQIGLLTPSRRTSAGHRLYDEADVARLYRISLLRRLGFPLDQITSVLDNPEWQLAPAVSRHLSDTRDRAAVTARLCTRLAAMAAELARQDNGLGAVTGITVVAVDDADAHHARSVAAGAQIVQEPVDQPYGIREHGARDPEGQLWFFQPALG